MERFETDLISDDGGIVRIDVGSPHRKVHVVVDDIDGSVPLGQWLASFGDSQPGRPSIAPGSLDRAELHDRRWPPS